MDYLESYDRTMKKMDLSNKSQNSVTYENSNTLVAASKVCQMYLLGTNIKLRENYYEQDNMLQMFPSNQKQSIIYSKIFSSNNIYIYCRNVDFKSWNQYLSAVKDNQQHWLDQFLQNLTKLKINEIDFSIQKA
ncbi:hypothetical protein ABPG72_003498 [Tetrahymena utriculariae]